MFYLIFCFLFFQDCYSLQNQDRTYFQIIKTLSQDSLFGRSIYQNGKTKALNYLKNYLQTQTTKGITFKEFSFDTTFNQISKISLKVNADNIFLEEQFIPNGDVPNLQGSKLIKSFSDAAFDEANLQQLISNKLDGDFVLLPISKNSKSSFSLSEKIQLLNFLNAGAIFIETDALLFSPSVHQSTIPIIWIKPKHIFDGDSVTLHIESKIEPYTVTNLLVTPVEISKKHAITLMAHYDHLGTINSSHIYNGANDNASGVAISIQLFLESIKRTNQTQLILTDAEELGLLGSKALQESGKYHPISYLINFDMLGSQEKGLATVGIEDTLIKNKLKTLSDSLNIPIKFRPNSPNSDHYFFLTNGTKGFYIYSNEGKQPYHRSGDDFTSLDYNFLIKAEHFVNHLLVSLGF